MQPSFSSVSRVCPLLVWAFAALVLSTSAGGPGDKLKGDPAGKSTVKALAPMLAPGNPCKLTAAERKAIKSLVDGNPLTPMQQDLLNALRQSSRPGLTPAMRQALAEALPADSPTTPLAQMLAPKDPCKLTGTERKAVQSLVAGSSLTPMQRDLLIALRQSSRAGLTPAMRQALAEELRRDQERPAKTADAKKETKTTTQTGDSVLRKIAQADNPLALSTASREAVEALLTSRPLTQVQRNLLATLQRSGTPGLTPEMRLAIGKGLNRDLERKKTAAKTVTPEADAAMLRKMLNPTNPYQLSLAQRTTLKRLLDGAPLSNAQRGSLMAVADDSKLGLSVEMRQVLKDVLRRDLERQGKAREIVPTVVTALPLGSKPASGKSKEPPAIGRSLSPAQKDNLLKTLAAEKSLKLTPQQRDAAKTLAAAGSATQADRNLAYHLLGSNDPTLSPAMRLALANSLRDDIDRKVQRPSSAKTDSLVSLLEPGNATKMTPLQRTSIQRLLAGSLLHEPQRNALFGMVRKQPSSLSAAQRLAITFGLNDDRLRRDIPTISWPGGGGVSTDSAREFLAVIKKVEGNKIIVTRRQKEEKAADVTLTVADNVKVLQAIKILTKVEVGGPIKNGLKNALFASGTTRARISTDDKGVVAQLLVFDPGDEPAGDTIPVAMEFLAVIKKVEANQVTVIRSMAKMKNEEKANKEAKSKKKAGTKKDGKEEETRKEMTLSVADDVKVLQGKFKKFDFKKLDFKKFEFRKFIRQLEIGEPIENGLMNELFASGNARARITTDGKGVVTQIIAFAPAVADALSAGGGDTFSGDGSAGGTTASHGGGGGGGGAGGPTPGDDGAANAETEGTSAETGETTTETSPEAKSGPSKSIRQTQRYLLITNATEEKLTVYVQYYTQKDKEEGNWLPGNPEEKSTEAVKIELDPEGTANVMDGDAPIQASRVRLWAVAASGSEWAENKTQDLLLVPEEDDQGQRWYAAAEVDTFTFTFSKE